MQCLHLIQCVGPASSNIHFVQISDFFLFNFNDEHTLDCSKDSVRIRVLGSTELYFLYFLYLPGRPLEPVICKDTNPRARILPSEFSKHTKPQPSNAVILRA